MDIYGLFFVYYWEVIFCFFMVAILSCLFYCLTKGYYNMFRNFRRSYRIKKAYKRRGV